MKPLSVAVLLALVVCGSSRADRHIFPDEVQLSVVPGWSEVGDQTVYPVQFIHEDAEAEFLIFRTDLAGDESVPGRAELKTAVQRIVDSVILTLPKAQLISNTGYDEKERVQFALEFLSETPGDSLPLRHRLVGYLYRALDGHQILFTLWGKGLLPHFKDRLAEVLAMQKSFAFSGPHDATVFGTSPKKWYLVTLLTIIVIVVALYTRARKQAVADSQESPSEWNCLCGEANIAGHYTCRKCGRRRHVSAEVS